MPQNRYLDRMADVPAFAGQAACQKFRRTLDTLDVMQVNSGKRCNLSCKHCHIDAGTQREEVMSREVMTACLRVFEAQHFKTLDITGGAPEMNPDLPWFVEEAAQRGIHTIVRTNLAIFQEEGFGHFPAFFAKNRVELVASLPHYGEAMTDKQRGDGVFAACIAGMQALNALGYGSDPDLPLNLVFNPGGAFLPPDQKSIEADYRRQLESRYGIAFNNLYTITNNPIGRFGDFLERSGNLEGYMKRLVGAFNPAAAANMMCRSQVSVDWDGTLYDCDFNLALGLPANIGKNIRDLNDAPLAREIVFANHCYACTAGAGSSCGGATA